MVARKSEFVNMLAASVAIAVSVNYTRNVTI
jgi:hypothetical protein